MPKFCQSCKRQSIDDGTCQHCGHVHGSGNEQRYRWQERMRRAIADGHVNPCQCATCKSSPYYPATFPITGRDLTLSPQRITGLITWRS